MLMSMAKTCIAINCDTGKGYPPDTAIGTYSSIRALLILHTGILILRMYIELFIHTHLHHTLFHVDTADMIRNSSKLSEASNGGDVGQGNASRY